MHTITARLNHPDAGSIYKDCYAYDYPEIGLVAEPLVHETTNVIKCVLIDHPDNTPDNIGDEVTLVFSTHRDQLTTPDRSVTVQLDHLKTEEDTGFSRYQVEVIAPTEAVNNFEEADLLFNTLTAYLCPHLLDYFPEPPKTFYCTITPTAA